MKLRMLLLLFAIAFVPAAKADVKPHAICSDGMVLQQKSKAKVWGTATGEEKVAVTFRGKTASTVAGRGGEWVVEIETGDAGGPFEMIIAGSSKVVYKNILVGEVWVCSGQSNMNWSIDRCDEPDQKYAKSAAPNANLRMFTVAQSTPKEPQANTSGTWTEASPKTVGAFSAVGYAFGRNLHEKMKIPVGMIHTSVGGTRIEAWMSAKALEATGLKIGPGKGANEASVLYNGMIAPIVNYQVKGAIWYQGESNAGNAYQYRTLHPAMIENWRTDFRNPDLAFYLVQLAPYTAILKKPADSNWAELREAQTMTLKVKNTGMAVITDLGDEADIHPTPKQPVGERLALAARALTYGEKIVYSGPMYKTAKFDGNKAVLTFAHVGGGLVGKEMVAMPSRNKKAAPTLHTWRVKESSSESAALTGFTMCGKDKVFHDAKADIAGDTVVVTCAAVTEPIAVRYGWANHPLCNLFNREGLPASPFRTDMFPGVTAPK